MPGAIFHRFLELAHGLLGTLRRRTMNALDQELPFLTIATRLLAAAVIGAVIGLDRERLDKPAGLRTHMLVSLGSATFVLLAIEVGAQLTKSEHPAAYDPTRVLQGVVGGIGFLGAGSIIQARGHVSGMTTAASVWMVGALGAALGLGAYALAGVAFVLAIITLTALGGLERLLRGKQADAEPRNDVPTEGEPEASRKPKSPPPS